MCRILALSRSILLWLPILVLIGGGYGLMQSTSGLRALAHLAGEISAGQLSVGASHGRLSGPLRIEQLRWEQPGLTLEVSDLQLDWRPSALLQRELAITSLHIGQVQLTTAATDEQRAAPQEIRLPVTVSVEKWQISVLDWMGVFQANDLSGQLSSDGTQHRLLDFVAHHGALKLSAAASLGAAAPLPLDFSAHLEGTLAERPLRLALAGSGPLQRIALSIKAEAGWRGQGQATITPFAAPGYADVQLALSDINPADWYAAAPSARLALNLQLQPQGAGVAGEFSLSNAQAGPLDRQRLPLVALSGQLAGDHRRLQFSQLQARLSGAGSLRGQALWQDDALGLDLEARQIDAAALLTTLRPTRLGGQLSAQLAVAQQSLRGQLSDPRFTLNIEAAHRAGRVSVPVLELAAAEARLSAAGTLDLGAGMAFTLAGELRRFDPSRFIKHPAALINAQFNGSGKLSPQPQLKAQFAISQSRLAGEPLAGQGTLDIDWPRVQQADIQLQAGANRLRLSGAYGQPDNQLEMTIEAPQLAPYGIEGGLKAQLQLTGLGDNLRLHARAEAARLGLPGVGQIKALQLNALAGIAADAPLEIDLRIARVDIPALPDALRTLHLASTGTTAQHYWQLSGELGAEATTAKLQLDMRGGLEAGRWQGEVVRARLNGGPGDQPARPPLSTDQSTPISTPTSAPISAHLSEPAKLRLAPDAWSFGPAKFAGGEPGKPWQIELQAMSDGRRLQGQIGAQGPRQAQLHGQIDAQMRSAWALNESAPWQASLQSRVDDLSGFASLIGEGVKTAGRLNAQLEIRGSPAQPVSSGRLQGQELRIQVPEQGLHLARGTLDMVLRDNLLQVNQCHFDSLLQAPPRTLLRSDRSAVSKLIERPGRLEIRGEMRVDRKQGAERAALDIQLERFGVYQQAEQWVLLSGQGHLRLADKRLSLEGKLAADAGYWQLAATNTPRLSDDVVIHSRQGEAPRSRLRPELNVDLSASLGPNFYFNGAGLSSRLVGDIRLRAQGRDLPRASGSIRSRDGRFSAYGQQLEIQRGILSFQGLIDNPALDIRAVRSGLAVEPGVQIGGTAQKPIVKLISAPDLPDAEKLSWLVLGHGPEQLGAGDAALLLGAAGSILGRDSGGVVQQIKSTLGLDELAVRQGQLADNESRARGSRVAGGGINTTAATGNQILSVGKRLSSNALLSYEQTLGQAESIVKLTVNLSREISVIGRAGSDNALDIFYTLIVGRR